LNILAFDTSTEYCSVALWRAGEVLVREVVAGQGHSELLLPMVDEILAEAGLALTQLDGIAFGSGPGSFTGLRIACGVAQGLALGADLPVLGICTLEALAEAAAVSAAQERVVAALDARMGEIYHAAYHRDDNAWQAVSAPSLCLPQDAPPLSGTGWVVCGNGFAVYAEQLQACYRAQIASIAAPHQFPKTPHAREIASLAAPRFLQGLGTDAAEAAPLYIRNKVALKETERDWADR